MDDQRWEPLTSDDRRKRADHPVRIVVASGKGGTGKTTVATSMAAVLADQGLPTCYVDCDAEEPNGHLFLKPVIHQRAEVLSCIPQIDHERCTRCGSCVTSCRAGALLLAATGVVVFPDLCNGCGGCLLACSDNAIHETGRPIGTVCQGVVTRSAVDQGVGVTSARDVVFVQGETLVGMTSTPEVIRATIAAAPAGHTLVLDAPPGTTCPTVEALRTADVAVLVAEPTPFGLNDLTLTVEVVRYLGIPFAVAINRVGIGDNAVADYCREENIPIVLELAHSRKIAEAYSRGDLIVDTFGDLREDFRALAGSLRTLAQRKRCHPTLTATWDRLFPSSSEDKPEPTPSTSQETPAVGQPREVVVISGKGGTGKTSITASFLALAGHTAAAVDCDADASNLHLVLQPRIRGRWPFSGGSVAVIDQAVCHTCGSCADACRFQAISLCLTAEGGYTVDSLACEGCGVCVDVCPTQAVTLVTVEEGEWFVSDTRHGPMVHARLTPGRKNSGKLVSLMREETRAVAQINDRPMVVADGSPGIGCAVIASITGVCAVVIVSEPTLSGLHDLRRVIDLAKKINVPVGVCVNKADLNPDMACRLELEAVALGVPVLGRVRYDEAVTQAQLRGTSVVEMGDSPASADIRRLWQHVLQLTMT